MWYGQGERQDANPSRPCVVKNTFLHIVAEGHADNYDRSNGSMRRERSEPAKLRQPVQQESESHYARNFDPNDSEASYDELDNMNNISLGIHSDCSWLPQSSAGSTRQVSAVSQDFSIVSDDTDYSPAGQAPTCLPMPSSLCGRLGSEGSTLADTGSTPEDWEAPPDAEGQESTGGVLGRSHLVHAGMHDVYGPKRRLRFDPMPWDAGVVTVMVRQIPRQFTQLMLLKEANKRGYEGLYDFLYLPFDLKKGINVGYGFLNFIDPKHAQAFRHDLDGAFLDKHMRMKGKPLRIHPAKVQGYEANYQHFVQTKTGQKQDPHFSPLFFTQGGSAGMQSATSPAMQDSMTWPAQPAADEGSRGSSCHIDGGQAGFVGHPHWPQVPEQQAASAPVPMNGGWCFPGAFERHGQAAEYSDLTPPSFSSQQFQHGTDHSGQQNNVCQMCGLLHLSEHNFCAHCGTAVSNRAVSRNGPQQQQGPRNAEASAQLLQEFQVERRRLWKELAAVQAKVKAQQPSATNPQDLRHNPQDLRHSPQDFRHSPQDFRHNPQDTFKAFVREAPQFPYTGASQFGSTAGQSLEFF